MPSPRASDPRFHDFDAALDEIEGGTIPFKVMGKVWELPGAVDATVILRIQRLMMMVASVEEGGEVPDDLVVDEDLSYERMCRQMIGDELMDTWLTYKWTDGRGRKREGMSYPLLQAVAQRLFAIHAGTDPDAVQGSGKAPRQPADRKPPSRSGSRSPRKRSSSTGR